MNEPPTPDHVELTDELAKCLRSFLEARADELTMRRALAVLASWDELQLRSRSAQVLAVV